MHRIHFIINPKAGVKRKKKFADAIRQYMDRDRFACEILYTSRAGEAPVMARDAADKGYYAVVAVGGDGTVNEVGRGLVGTETALGIIPCGSGDGLALHIGMSRIPSVAVKSINDGKVTDVDYCTVNGHPFFCTCGVGFDALVSMEFTKSGKRGLMTYTKKALENWMRYTPLCYEIETDKGPLPGRKLVLVTFANASQWGNNVRIAPDASMTDGWLDVTMVKPFNMFQAGLLAVQLLAGTLDRNSLVETFRCRSLTIRRQTEGPVHFDGDPSIMGTELNIKVVPRGLKLLIPSETEQI